MSKRAGYLTFPVAGAAYRKLPSIADGLTHSYNSEEGKVLCKVKPSSILDDTSYDEAGLHLPPTCPVCAKRDARF